MGQTRNGTSMLLSFVVRRCFYIPELDSASLSALGHNLLRVVESSYVPGKLLGQNVVPGLCCCVSFSLPFRHFSFSAIISRKEFLTSPHDWSCRSRRQAPKLGHNPRAAKLKSAG